MNNDFLKKLGLALLALIFIFIINLLIGINLTIIGIYEIRSLRWLPLFLASISTFFAGLILRRQNWKWNILLFSNLIFLTVIGALPQQMILWTCLVILNSIILTRKNLKARFKIPVLLSSLSILTYFLFAQPLILKLDGFGTTISGDLVNAKLILGDLNSNRNYVKAERFQNVNGKYIDLKELKQKNIFINFWATWCGPCISEKPFLDSLKKSFGNREDLLFVDIAIGQDKNEWLKFLEDENPSGLQLISSNQGTTSVNFGFDGIPFKVLVNKEGQFKAVPSPSFFNPHQLLRNDSTIDIYVNTPIKIHTMK